MIYSLTGKVHKLDENTIVVDTNGVSFEVTCSYYTVSSLIDGTEQTIFTYLQVKEDAFCLFGFKDKKEKMLFKDLIEVSGVGPKMAITILSGMSIANLISAIISSDVKSLSSIKGLGKKTAERLVLELNNKFGGENGLESLINNSENLTVQSNLTKLRREIEEASDVLVSTGISKNQALEIAKNNFKDGMTSEELVIVCFKNLK